MSDNRAWIWRSGLMAALCCTAAAAQDDGGDNRDAYLPKAFIRGVEVRLPAEMREDEPLLIGIEQEHNHFRDRTPLLADASKAPHQVDADELYRRHLAMYEASETDDASPGTAGTRATVAKKPARAPMPVRPGLGLDLGIFRGIMLAVACALGIGAAVTSFRQRQRAAGEERAARRSNRRRR